MAISRRQHASTEKTFMAFFKTLLIAPTIHARIMLNYIFKLVRVLRLVNLAGRT